ncbi:MAG: multidrug efflux SMR transporter, partial [Desulfuromonadaceae bacterium]
MSWLILGIAGLFEVSWAIGLKYTAGFTRPLPTFLTLIAMVVSMWLLSVAMRNIPV